MTLDDVRGWAYKPHPQALIGGREGTPQVHYSLKYYRDKLVIHDKRNGVIAQALAKTIWEPYKHTLSISDGLSCSSFRVRWPDANLSRTPQNLNK